VKQLKNINLLPPETYYTEMQSPVGSLIIMSSSQGLHAVLWENDCENPRYKTILTQLHSSNKEKTIVQTIKQLTEYFDGKRKIFDLPLVMHGTDFQRKAWQQLQKIPYAETLSYGEQAQKMGDKNKARAVGAANGSNPISIIIPCHRVNGGNGKLIGFRGGVEKKAFLLELEKMHRNL
jgi:methylated-DNA-[protein]-cysteine S-methyltransferase